MKKILYFITQSEFGGAQRYVFDLADNLKNNYEVAVAYGKQLNNVKLAKILNENNIKHFLIPRLKRNISPMNDVLSLFEIIKLIKNYRPDIIHLNSSKISILGSIAAFLIRLFAPPAGGSRHSHYSQIRIIYTVHGWVFNEPLPLWQKSFYKFAEKFSARFKDKIICVSEFDKQLTLKYKIAPAEKLVTIHNGLTPVTFNSKEEARQIMKEQSSAACHPGLDPGSRVQCHGQISGLSWLRQISRSDDEVKPAMTDTFIVGSIGYLYKTKGFEYLIEAARILISNFKFPISFIIIGDGAERNNLEKLIKKNNLENNFILAGQIDQAARLLPAFDIYVCSSIKEGFPYSILEAMSAGLPVVSTSVGGIPEMIENEKTGLLAKPADAKNLAEKIQTLLNNKTLAVGLGQRAQAKVKAEFGLEKMVEATKKIYG